MVNLKRLLVAGGAAASLVLLVASASVAAKVEPILLPGASNEGKTCDNLEGVGQTWTELKVDPNADGTFSDGTLTVTISHTSADKVFDWTSNIGVDAVIVKAGSEGSYLYRYDPPGEQTSDSGLTSPGHGNAISHITFCYDGEVGHPPSHLIVEKLVVNDDGGTAVASDFSFSVNGGQAQPFESDGSNDLTIEAGTYTVTEPAVAGYTTSYSNCFHVVVPAGGSATCTITNDDEPGGGHNDDGRLTVIKHVVNDDGGTAVADDWQMNVAGPTPLTFAGAEDPGTTNTVDAGAYKIMESGGPAGYALSYSGDCDADGNVTVPVFLDAVCILTNDDELGSHEQPAHLIVRKLVVNDSGGTKVASDFSFSVNGAAAQPFEADAENDVSVPAGTYSVTEPAVPGYTTSYSHCDNLVLAAGESAVCTITNDDVPGSHEQPAHLIVRKLVVNDSGGTKVASDFSFSVNGGAAQPFEADAENDVSVPAGTYSVTEPAVPGYTTSYSHCDNIVLAAGESAVCTITNDDVPGSLTIIKHVVNDSGGTAVGASWTMTVTGPTPLSFPGAEAPGLTSTVNPGTYVISESGGPSGYALSYSGDCDSNGTVIVTPFHNSTCTLTNDDLPATLIVRKVVVNDDGGTRVASDFSFSVNGGAAQPFEADAQNNLTVNAGTYSVTEPAVPGYATNYSNCSNVLIPNGGSTTCTITNDDEPATHEPAHLIVRKLVVNDSGGTKVASDFSFSVNGGAAQPFEADGENDVSVPAGTYSVTEPAVSGYATSYSNCSNLAIPEGGSATCTITNNDVPRGQGSISVSKSANPTSVKEPGGLVAYSVSITNTSLEVDVTITNVVDDKFGDLDDDGGSGCFDVPINLAPGQSAGCQFSRQITGAGGASHVNTVTATGRDEHGNPLSGSDDARVDITERLIDLVLVKDATSPTPLNGIVTYTLTVTNKGPDPATNVQLADPAPAGVSYLTASPSQGTCSVAPALVTCALGTIQPGQSVTVTVTGRATHVGRHVNTATVTGAGGHETNPADNVDSAETVVPAPFVPPTPKPKPTPKPELCLTLTVSPKMVTADGRPDRVVVKVTEGKKRIKGARVLIAGAGVRKTARTNGKGLAIVRINPSKVGIIGITALETERSCGPKRIGVVGVFLPPVTG